MAGLMHKSLTELVNELLTELRKTGVPYSSQARRAVLTNQAEEYRPRSCLLGLYTKMGLGIATQTERKKWVRVLALIHSIALHRPKSHRVPYAAIMLNCNTKVPVHADAANTGRSSLLSLGCHQGGELWMEDPNGDVEVESNGEMLKGRALDTFGKWVCFDGHTRHCILPARPIEGGSPVVERYSITLFCPGRLDAVPEEIWGRLQAHGFPVEDWCQAVPKGEKPPPLETSKAKRGKRGRRTPYEAPASLSAGLLSAAPAVVAGERGAKRAAHGSKTACTVSLDACWQRLLSGRLPSRFLEFLRQGQNYKCATVGEEFPSPNGGRQTEGLDPLPCALPYTWEHSSAPRSSRRRARWGKVRRRRLWINASIAYLDWIYLGKPSGRKLPWAESLRGPLSERQWHLVKDLEASYLAACRLGETSEDPSGGLLRLATDLHHSLAMSYGMGTDRGLQ
eukprot:4123158-Amphidinium_carterae.2